MKFLEKDLEEIIFNNKELLYERGIDLCNKLKRQVKIGNYGIADIIGFDKPYYEKINENYFCHVQGKIQIIELKNDKINISAFLQAINYLKGIKRYLEKRKFNTNHYIFEIVLIAQNIDNNSSFIYLPELLQSTEFQLTYYTFKYDIDGIKFENECGYKLSNEGF